MATDKKLRVLVPKGRIEKKVLRVLARTGMELRFGSREYKPVCSDPDLEVKMLKPQNIPPLVELGRHDCGFTGYDWIVEQRSKVRELLDLGYDPVRIVSAVPESGPASNGRLVVASEYRRITQNYIDSKGLDAIFVQAYGATEALPPDDADMIVENTSTGTTLSVNRLRVVDEIMTSTTRFICNEEAYERDDWKRAKMEQMAMLIRSTLEADRRSILEMNVPPQRLEDVVAALPCMRSPTVSPLHGEDGYAVKVALARGDVTGLVPKLRKMGATDILEYRAEKIVV
ncbi:ATP phosphoribosyltransferase [Candidatus Fermentibacteria bacterium]|nr:ATP phosphoribosyltransferase [Candidatus Fermentibacteria bacterium]